MENSSEKIGLRERALRELVADLETTHREFRDMVKVENYAPADLLTPEGLAEYQATYEVQGSSPDDWQPSFAEEDADLEAIRGGDLDTARTLLDARIARAEKRLANPLGIYRPGTRLDHPEQTAADLTQRATEHLETARRLREALR